MSVAQQVVNVKKSAEKMDAAKTERIGSPSDYDVVRQGDLYLVCLPKLVSGEETKDRQLAPGTTQGSRHIAAGNCVITIPRDPSDIASSINYYLKSDVASELIGPVIECKGDVEITHPEHGNKILPKGTTWAVVYQRAYAEEVRRVQD